MRGHNLCLYQEIRKIIFVLSSTPILIWISGKFRILPVTLVLQVEQLAEYGEEETVVLTASVANYCFSPLGSKSGRAFLEQRADIKSDFMQFCLKQTSQLEGNVCMSGYSLYI